MRPSEAPRPPITSFSGPYRWLSNFYPAQVEYEGHQLPERRARVCGGQDHEIGRTHQGSRVRGASCYAIAHHELRDEQGRCWECAARAVKKLGKSMTLRPDWNEVKLEVMTELLRQKFAVEPLRSQLLATYPAELVEGNTWHDNGRDNWPLHENDLWEVVRMAIAMKPTYEQHGYPCSHVGTGREYGCGATYCESCGLTVDSEM